VVHVPWMRATATAVLLTCLACSSSNTNNEEGGGSLPVCNPVPSGSCAPDASAGCFYCADVSAGAVCSCNAAHNDSSDAGPQWVCVGTEQSGQCTNWTPPDSSR
jgi:hypothetical protein